MRHTLIALATVAATFALAAPASAAHQCSGTVDTQCYTWVCSRTTCLEVNCPVWTDVVAGPQSGCIG